MAVWILGIGIQLGQIDEFFYRATLCVSAVFAVVRCPSICQSVRVARLWIVSIRLKISSNFLLGPVAPSL